MKRFGNIYHKIYDLENLKEAHRNARRDKLFYKEVKMVDSDPDFYLKEIQKMLIEGTYKVSPYTVSIINDKGKARELMKLPYYPDRIIQWAIMLQIEPIFMNVFIHSTCASLTGRGIHRASGCIRKYLKDKEGTKYCYKIDVKHFYPSIKHCILKDLLRRKFKDKRTLDLIFRIIDSSEGGVGIPIGSYLSQYLANFYLAYFDHWIKETLKIKYFVRYMDDIVILHHSKEFLHELHHTISKYLTENLELSIKGNWQIFPTEVRGIDFVGYRHYYTHQTLRKSTFKRFKRRMLVIRWKKQRGILISAKEWSSYNSYQGWVEWCNSYKIRVKYMDPVKDWVEVYYCTKIKKGGRKNVSN